MQGLDCLQVLKKTSARNSESCYESREMLNDKILVVVL